MTFTFIYSDYSADPENPVEFEVKAHVTRHWGERHEGGRSSCVSEPYAEVTCELVRQVGGETLPVFNNDKTMQAIQRQAEREVEAMA